MMTYNSPQEYAAKAKEYLLPALRFHFRKDYDPKDVILNGYNPCLDCPYWSGPNTDHCNDSFLMFLPDTLRRYDDPRASALADRLDVCNAYLAGKADDICAGCPYYETCRLEDDPDPVIQDVYELLIELGAYEKET